MLIDILPSLETAPHDLECRKRRQVLRNLRDRGSLPEAFDGTKGTLARRHLVPFLQCKAIKPESQVLLELLGKGVREGRRSHGEWLGCRRWWWW